MRRLSPALAVLAALAATPSGPRANSFALTPDDVQRIAQQAAAEAAAAGLRATIAVVDAEANVLGVFRMDRAPAATVVEGRLGEGIEGLALEAAEAAIAKASSGALLSSGGNAFSTRTASFIVQENFPPGVDFTPGGPLFGVQLSSLPCGDFKRPASPLGLSGDPGGLPLYRDGRVVGGIGVEGDGVYGVDEDPTDLDDASEERAALAGTRGFDGPDAVRADRILADGIRLPFVAARVAGGAGVPRLEELVPARGGLPSSLVPASAGGVAGRADPRFPVRGGTRLSASEVARILEQAARQAARTRAAIRQPLGDFARVSIAVVDLDGSVLGFFQLDDAPNFGIDVSLQKARTANFFSSSTAGRELQLAGLGVYLQDGVPLDGSVAYSSRAIGFLAQPYFPPGIPGAHGPFSVPIGEWSPFHTGLHLELVAPGVLGGLSGGCHPSFPRLPNGITIFPGGLPLFKDGQLGGAIGISGDGVDQDDLIASAGSAGFEAPPERRSDRLVVRGVRLPWVKFPRHPEL